MKRLHVSRRAFVLFIFTVLGPAALSAHTITIGNIDDEPAYVIKKFAPVAAYLSRELRAEGFTEGRVVVAQSLTEMAALLRDRKVDLHIDSYVRALALRQLTGSQLSLRRWKRGVAEYHGFIFVRKDSNLGKLEDLRGKTIAFDEMFSAVSYLVPKLLLMERGLNPVPSSMPAGFHSVGYVLTKTDENTMQWVLSGKTAAGAIDHQRYAKEARSRIDELKILEQTPSVPRHIVGVRPDLAPQLSNRIKEILIRMDRSEEGKKILQDFEQTAKFDELSEHNVALAVKLKKLIEAELKLQ
jgi:phosphonate transport system substrate-binding protein